MPSEKEASLGNHYNQIQETWYAPIESAEVFGMLLVDDFAREVLFETSERHFVKSEEIDPKINSLANAVSLHFLKHQGLIIMASVGIGITDRGKSAVELTKKALEELNSSPQRNK